MYCAHCGIQIESDSVYCSECGAKVAPAGDPPKPQSSLAKSMLSLPGTARTRPRLRANPVVNVLLSTIVSKPAIVLACILVALCGLLWGLSHGGTDTAVSSSHGVEQSNMSATESIAVGNIRTILGAENAFFSSNGRYGSFKDLTTATPPFLDGQWDVTKRGYDYSITVTNDGKRFEVVGIPHKVAEGQHKGFWSSEEGGIRYTPDARKKMPNMEGAPIDLAQFESGEMDIFNRMLGKWKVNTEMTNYNDGVALETTHDTGTQAITRILGGQYLQIASVLQKSEALGIIGYSKDTSEYIGYDFVYLRNVDTRMPTHPGRGTYAWDDESKTLNYHGSFSQETIDGRREVCQVTIERHFISDDEIEVT